MSHQVLRLRSVVKLIQPEDEGTLAGPGPEVSGDECKLLLLLSEDGAQAHRVFVVRVRVGDLQQTDRILSARNSHLLELLRYELHGSSTVQACGPEQLEEHGTDAVSSAVLFGVRRHLPGTAADLVNALTEPLSEGGLAGARGALQQDEVGLLRALHALEGLPELVTLLLSSDHAGRPNPKQCETRTVQVDACSPALRPRRRERWHELRHRCGAVLGGLHLVRRADILGQDERLLIELEVCRLIQFQDQGVEI